MKAMLMAAGRGTRMRPLTDSLPKPLLRVANKSLIVHHIEALVRAEIYEIVINLSYLGHLIEAALGDGAAFGARIQYSHEAVPLEFGGGVIQALPLLGSEPFAVVAADLFTDYPFAQLPQQLDGLAHLVLADNPTHHPEGDFGLVNGQVDLRGAPRLNYAGIGVYHPELFVGYNPGVQSFLTVVEPAVTAGQVSGEHYQGHWFNIGTPESLAEAERKASALLSVYH
jgi:N-acetyl-alpha-D-muramate 1-phosphate uridylyltransferase